MTPTARCFRISLPAHPGHLRPVLSSFAPIEGKGFDLPPSRRLRFFPRVSRAAPWVGLVFFFLARCFFSCSRTPPVCHSGAPGRSPFHYLLYVTDGSFFFSPPDPTCAVGFATRVKLSHSCSSFFAPCALSCFFITLYRKVSFFAFFLFSLSSAPPSQTTPIFVGKVHGTVHSPSGSSSLLFFGVFNSPLCVYAPCTSSFP